MTVAQANLLNDSAVRATEVSIIMELIRVRGAALGQVGRREKTITSFFI